MTAPHQIDTARLQLVASHPSLAEPVAAYYKRNATYFAPWDPPLPADHASVIVVYETLVEGKQAFTEGRGLRWWVKRRDLPKQVIGSINLSGITRGPFQNCFLGYSLDQTMTGNGLMNEALQSVIQHAFGPVVNLHRVQAAVRPENARSLAVLARLGFRDEGLSRDYLYIDGAWRDHRIFALTNPGFEPPEHWPRKDTP